MLTNRIFRLFVSSTFSDFIAERAALQKRVLMLSIDTAVVDISALIDYAARRGCRIAYMSTIATGFGAFLLINPPAPA